MRGLVRLLLLGVLAGVAVVSAGDQAVPAPAAPLPPAPGPAASPAGDIEDFVPSEKVSADDAVAFPVDI